MQVADREDVDDRTPRTTPVLTKPMQGLSFRNNNNNNNSTSSFEHWPSVASFGGKAFQAACGRLSNTATGNGCRRPPSCGPDRSDDTALGAAPNSQRLLGVSCSGTASSVRAVDLPSCYSSKGAASDRSADYVGRSGPRSAPRAASNKAPNLDYAGPKSAAATRLGSSRAQPERDSDFYVFCSRLSSTSSDLEASPRQVSRQVSRLPSHQRRQSQLYLID